MSTLIGYRLASRSPKVGLGGKDLSGTANTWVNVENARVRRDLARHNAIGQILQTQAPRYQLDTAQVEAGCRVTPRLGSITVDIGPGAIRYLSDGSLVQVPAKTQALAPNATNPIVSAVGYDTSTAATPAAAILSGTAAANITNDRFQNAYFSLSANPALESTANRTWLALIRVPPAQAAGTGVAATGVLTATGHGFKVGDDVWFSTLTGVTAGLSTATVYYVASTPDANTYTVSATPGGPTIKWTTNASVVVVQRQLHQSDVLDVRP